MMLGVSDVPNKILNQCPTEGYFFTLYKKRCFVLFSSVKIVCPGSTLGEFGVGAKYTTFSFLSSPFQHVMVNR